MEEKVNLYLAETTKGKLRPDCENLVSQAALHKNVLLPAMERIIPSTHEVKNRWIMD